jgi:hypothetical protein
MWPGSQLQNAPLIVETVPVSGVFTQPQMGSILGRNR